MGCGKTTIGQLLAQQLSYRFFDTDRLIEQSTQQSVSQIFAESGEVNFRQLETQVLAELSSYTRLVVATGGGIVLQRQNWSYLHHGIVLWLDVPVEQLLDRLQGDQTRPLLQTPNPIATLQHLLEQRRHLYAQADVRLTVAPNTTPIEVVEQAIAAIQQVVKPPAQPIMVSEEN